MKIKLGTSSGIYLGAFGGSGGAVDTLAPTVVITANAATITAAAFTATFTFSEGVTGFALGDITVGNASAGTFNTVSPSVYTAVITPTATGTVTIDVSAGVCQDAAGNNNTQATQFSILYVAPVAWYDFSNVSELFQDAARTTPVTADGDPIGSVGNAALGDWLTAATTARPTYRTNGQNSKSIAEFDGTSDQMAVAFATAHPQTIFIAFKVRENVTNAHIFNGNTTDRRMYTGNSANGRVLYAGSFVGGNNGTDATFEIDTCVFNGASSSIAINGGSDTTGNVGATPGDGFSLSKVNGGGARSKIDVGEVLYFEGALSASVQSEIKSYLGTKWAVF